MTSLPATDKQISYITGMSRRYRFTSPIAAIDAYGLGLRPARDLTRDEASEVIEWFKRGAPIAQSTPQPFEPGTRFASEKGTGKIITLLSDGRVLVKLDDGRSDFLDRDDFVPEVPA